VAMGAGLGGGAKRGLGADGQQPAGGQGAAKKRRKVGRCTLTSVETHSLKATGFKPLLPLKINPGFQNVSFQIQTLRLYSAAGDDEAELAAVLAAGMNANAHGGGGVMDGAAGAGAGGLRGFGRAVQVESSWTRRLKSAWFHSTLERLVSFNTRTYFQSVLSKFNLCRYISAGCSAAPWWATRSRRAGLAAAPVGAVQVECSYSP
jgi:hypothetical protein